jgi:hypothetical protein
MESVVNIYVYDICRGLLMHELAVHFTDSKFSEAEKLNSNLLALRGAGAAAEITKAKVMENPLEKSHFNHLSVGEKI